MTELRRRTARCTSHPPDMVNHNVTFRLPAPALAELNALAEERGVRSSALLRVLVLDGLGRLRQ